MKDAHRAEDRKRLFYVRYPSTRPASAGRRRYKGRTEKLTSDSHVQRTDPLVCTQANHIQPKGDHAVAQNDKQPRGTRERRRREGRTGVAELAAREGVEQAERAGEGRRAREEVERVEREPRGSGQREERAVCALCARRGLEDVGVDGLEGGEEGAEESEEEAEECEVVIAVSAAGLSVGGENGMPDNVREGDAGHDRNKREDL